MNRPKVFVRTEKRLACDLDPGDLFIVDLPDPEYFNRELNRADVALIVMLRTNVSADDIEDKETLVHKLTIVTAYAGEAPEVKVDPHAPPGMKRFES